MESNSGLSNNIYIYNIPFQTYVKEKYVSMACMGRLSCIAMIGLQHVMCVWKCHVADTEALFFSKPVVQLVL